MANRNIPGSGNITGAINDFKAASSSPGESFSGLDSTVSKLRESMSKGNIAPTRDYLKDISRELPRLARESEQWNRNEISASRQKIKYNEQLLRFSQTHSANLKKELNSLDATNEAHKQTINLIKQQISFESNEQNLIRSKNREIQTGIEKTRAASYEQKRSYNDAITQTKRVAIEVDKLEKQRQRSFGSNLFKNNFNPIQAAKDYGMQKMEFNRPNVLGGAAEEGSSLGGFAAGALATLGGAVLGKLLEKVGEMTMRGLKAAVVTGDVFKGAGGDITGDNLGGIIDRRPNTVFRTTMHQAMSGLGVNLEEQAQLAQVLRPIMGNAGNFAEVMRQGTAQDRAFGSALGTGGAFFAQMVRRSDSTSSDADLNKMSIGISEAIGRGQLVGLQEEMLHGITQLVELTRTQSTGGTSAVMFADMIANLSQTGDKSMRGDDAARVLGSLDTSLRNPKNQYGQLIAAGGLRAALTQLVAEKKISPSELNSENVLFLQAQGLAATVPGINGENVQFGDLFAQKAVEQSNRIGGKGSKLAAMALANTLGISPTQALTLSNNVNFLGTKQGSDFRNAFGLGENNGILTNVGTNSFIQSLAGEFSATRNQSTPVSDRQKQMFLDNAILKFERTLPSNKLSELEELRKGFTGKSVAEQTRAVLDFSKTVTSGSPEDDLRNAVVEIENKITTLVDNVVPAINAIASKVTSGLSGNEYFSAKAQETLMAAKDNAARQKQMERDSVDYTSNPDVNILDQARSHFFSLERDSKAQTEANKAKITQIAQSMGVDPKFAMALGSIETGGSFNHHQISRKGAVGLMQLMPKTAASMGINPYDLDENIRGGVMYARDQLKRFHGDPLLAAAAYNAGPGAVLKAGGVPHIKETEAYVEKIKKLLGITDDNIPSYLPRTEAQRTQDSGGTSKVGLENNVNITVANQSGQPIQQHAKQFVYEIANGNNSPNTSYKSNTNGYTNSY